SRTRDDESETAAASFWERNEMSLKDIALSVASAFVLVTISFKLADFIGDVLPEASDANILLSLVRGIFADQYLMLTTLTVFAVLLFSTYFENINGTREIGTFFIYLFFVVIGVPTSLVVIIKSATLLCLFVLFFVVLIIALANIIITFIFGKIFKFTLEESLLFSNANLGGPTTAAAMAIAKGWTNLIVPILLVGTLGYVFGNYLGTGIYHLIQ